jgi:hypothetical protein
MGTTRQARREIRSAQAPRHRAVRSRLPGAAHALALAGALAGLTCHTAPSPPTEDEQRAHDATELTTALSADETLDRALKEADDTSTKGDDSKAAELLETKALPDADDALAKAQAARVESAWGKDKKDRLVALLQDRKTEVPKYAAALRSGDPEARVAVLQKQIEQEKRALDLTSDIRAARP